MTECGCKVYGNQHGSWFRPCEDHGRLYEQAAAARGMTLEELLTRAVDEYVRRAVEEHS